MGATRWSDDHYATRSAVRTKSGAAVFAHTDAISKGSVAAGVHESLDPKKMKGGFREARDSAEHPESNAVFVGFDVTGSMGEVPKTVQKNLCSLMGLLLRKSYLIDPAICVAAIGDATCDRAPFQVGQFESGIEIENDLTNFFLEGGGGGQQTESYELALYFLAKKTACDCWDKRKKRGYAFLIGDEMAYPSVSRSRVEDVFGDHLQSDIALRDILTEAREKWEIFYVLPRLTSYYDSPTIIAHWKDLLVQNAMKLDDPEGISELIASTIGLSEGAVDVGILTRELTDAGIAAGVANSIEKALVPISAGKTDLALTRGTGLATL